MPESSRGEGAMRPSIARPGRMARKAVRLQAIAAKPPPAPRLLRRVVHVLLHCVLLVPRVLLRVAHAALGVALGLRRATVGPELVLHGVLRIVRAVLRILDRVAFRQSWQREG